jgi:glycosyltransferase involved in cell wall biosynthesis
MKKTIYINGRFLTQDITGVQRYAHEIIRALDLSITTKSIPDSEQYQIILVAPKRKIKHRLSLKKIKIVQSGLFGGHLWEQLLLPFISRKGILFSPGNTAPLVSLFIKHRMAVTIHSLSFHYFPESYSFSFRLLYKLMVPLILKYADCILTVSNSEKKQLIDYLPAAEERIVVIQNGGLPVNYNFSPPNPSLADIEKRQPYLLYVGALSRGKNIQGVIQAFRKIIKKTDFNLIVVGSSPAAFQKYNINIEDSVKKSIFFMGHLNHIDEMVFLYKHAFCLLFPSYYEASPLPPIEAMACGCPVICSDIPALRERCGEAALYCKAEDSEQIAAQILSLIRNTPLRGGYIKKGITHAAQFTWQKCAELTINAIVNQVK